MGINFYYMDMPQQKKVLRARGFTLIELLVALVIVGLLAAVIFANVGNARERAVAAQMLADFEKIHNALILMAQANHIDRWWSDNDADPPTIPGNTTNPQTNPSIQWLIDNGGTTGLGRYLSKEPSIGIGNLYQYDRDGNDEFDPDDDGCDTDPADNGVIIQRTQMENYQNIFDIIDRAVDGGNEPTPELCGKIRFFNTTGGYVLVYMISKDGRF